MATLDRPNPNPRDYELAQGKTELCSFWFIPDCPKFGFWTSKTEASIARDIWLKNYRSASQEAWERYCESYGFRQAMFK
jgi:hypothetical protein